MICAVYALLHFLVDLLCAWAMFSRFWYCENPHIQVLVYNFCAFALQMPLGTVLDLLCRGKTRGWIPSVFAFTGVGLTVLGAFTCSWILGLGNALFHLGGGVDVIRDDFTKKSGGARLGIFVAPGALGLYLGTQMGKAGSSGLAVIAGMAAAVALLAGISIRKQNDPPIAETVRNRIPKYAVVTLVLCSFAVVILRSATGFCAAFSWKATTWLAGLSVCAVALGKAAGGILAAGFGILPVCCISLVFGAVCFLFGELPLPGILALFLFNMTMPITLYILVVQLRELPGFSFGLLTFGLFLGYLPSYLELSIPLQPSVVGMLGSLVSLGLLLICVGVIKHGDLSS